MQGARPLSELRRSPNGRAGGHLINHVFPDVPVRQWGPEPAVPPAVPLAWNHDVCREVVVVFVWAVLGFLRARARRWRRDGRGAVAVIQRFGGALNLNVHIHALVLDGVFARDRAGALEVSPHISPDGSGRGGGAGRRGAAHQAPARSPGLGDGDDEGSASDAWADDAPVLAGLAAASVQGTVALGPHAALAFVDMGDPSEEGERSAAGGCHSRGNGFDLHAGLVVPAGQRDRLERVCRYVLRPPVSQERLHLTSEGQVRLELRQPWRDGTTDVVFDLSNFWAGWPCWCRGRASI